MDLRPLGIHPDSSVVVLTGAGISAESGIATFRDSGGLWEQHDVSQVATPEGFAANPDLVWRFYSQRRLQARSVEPNAGHFAVAALEPHFAKSICAAAGVPYANILSMLAPATHQSIATYLLGMTRQALDALSVEKDIPLYTLSK